MIDNDSLNNMVLQAVDNAIQDLVKQTIDNLVVDPQWVKKIETQINQHMTSRLLSHVSNIDLNLLLVEEIDNGIDRWKNRLLANFNTNGITDQAKDTQLTVTDDMVLVSNSLVAAGLQVANNANIDGDLEVKNLIVKGTVNTDNASWDEITALAADKALAKTTEAWKTELVNQVLEQAKQQGISFQEVRLNGKLLADGDTLGEHITESNIQHVGTLRNLKVDGLTSLNDNTVVVVKNRLGINTENPEMALTVWDEEVALIAGKIEKNTAFIGTSRKHSLSLGVNRNACLTIDADGLTAVDSLRIDRWKIAHSNEVPGWSGTRGDFVLNADPKPDSPFAWVCLGGFRWQALRSA